MQERVLRHYFSGECTLADLKADLAGAVVDHATFEEHPIEEMESYFEVTVEHLTALCDEVLAGNLASADLEPIGLCLIASDHFVWNEHTEEGKRVAVTVFDWSSPEKASPLTRDNVALFRQRLLGGSDPLRR